MSWLDYYNSDDYRELFSLDITDYEWDIYNQCFIIKENTMSKTNKKTYGPKYFVVYPTTMNSMKFNHTSGNAHDTLEDAIEEATENAARYVGYKLFVTQLIGRLGEDTPPMKFTAFDKTTTVSATV